MFELSLMSPQARVDVVCEALDALDALSVSVEDADAQTDAEQALFGEPGMPAPQNGWQRSRITGLFSSQKQAQDAFDVLKLQDFFDSSNLLAIVPVPEQDWVRLTQSQFAPVQITTNFWIVPTWHEPPAQADKVIRLDPGLAFGTGTHPTTQMCLRWIAAHAVLPGQKSTEDHELARVLDYGCGSGILAIGAVKCGAIEVDAVDIDQSAVDATCLNAKENEASVRAGLPDQVSGVYTTVVANILATPLKVLAPLLSGYVGQSGSLVLAGILERQVDELKDAYKHYLKLEVADSQDGWVLMTAKREV